MSEMVFRPSWPLHLPETNCQCDACRDHYRDKGTLTLVTARPDAEIAAEFKKRISEQLLKTCDIVSEANKAGFIVSFQLGLDFAGKQTIAQLSIAKPF